ncbi:MAG: hypothetical protein AAB432_02715 [Patescibacteria group bacterium]
MKEGDQLAVFSVSCERGICHTLKILTGISITLLIIGIIISATDYFLWGISICLCSIALVGFCEYSFIYIHFHWNHLSRNSETVEESAEPAN